jgi:hypothetical protein
MAVLRISTQLQVASLQRHSILQIVVAMAVTVVVSVAVQAISHRHRHTSIRIRLRVHRISVDRVVIYVREVVVAVAAVVLVVVVMELHSPPLNSWQSQMRTVRAHRRNRRRHVLYTHNKYR